VPIQKRSFCPISALCSKFYPRNINYILAVKFFAGLDLEQKSSFLDGHKIVRFAILLYIVTFELHLIEFVIFSLQGNQVFVFTFFNNLSINDDDDSVCIGDGG